MPKNNHPPIDVLLELMRDDNIRVAALAMEQMLKLGEDVDHTLAEYQEDTDPQLRGRIHQLGAIIARRRARERFLEAVRNETISLWSGVVEINVLYDPECSPASIEETMDEFVAEAPTDSPSAPAVASYMRELQFAFPDEDTLDIDLYLIERVMGTRFGSPALLCALARTLGERIGWQSTVVLHEGRFCLIDDAGYVMDPGAGWHLSRLRSEDRFHPCGRRDVWLGILAQIFVIALVDGNLRDLHHFGDLVTSLDGGTVEALPYPLGETAAPPEQPES